MSYEPGSIAERGDFNGDGLTDAIVTEGGTYCFGMTGYGYTLVSRNRDGSWRIMDQRNGIPSFLAVQGAEGWPDIEGGDRKGGAEGKSVSVRVGLGGGLIL